jgi:hypothetical protein
MPFVLVGADDASQMEVPYVNLVELVDVDTHVNPLS